MIPLVPRRAPGLFGASLEGMVLPSCRSRRLPSGSSRTSTFRFSRNCPDPPACVSWPEKPPQSPDDTACHRRFRRLDHGLRYRQESGFHHDRLQCLLGPQVLGVNLIEGCHMAPFQQWLSFRPGVHPRHDSGPVHQHPPGPEHNGLLAPTKTLHHLVPDGCRADLKPCQAGSRGRAGFP